MDNQEIDSIVVDFEENDFLLYSKAGAPKKMSGTQFNDLLELFKIVMDKDGYKKTEKMLKKAYGNA